MCEPSTNEPAPGRWAFAVDVAIWDWPDEIESEWNGKWLVEILAKEGSLWRCRHGITQHEGLFETEHLVFEGLTDDVRDVILVYS